MIREGREVWSRRDYILGTDICLFGNVSVRDPRHNSDHYMVMGCLHGTYLKEHARYLGGRKRLPLRPPTKPTREDRISAALQRDVPKPRAREVWKNAWISATTWILVGKRVSARRDIVKDQALTRRLGRAIREILKTDRKLREEEARAEVEELLGSDPPLHQEACHRIKGWYKAAVDRAPPPARVTLKRITAEKVELYSYVPTLGTNIPISMQPFPVDDSVPTEDETEWAVTRLRNHISGRPSVMMAEHLKRWLATARK